MAVLHNVPLDRIGAVSREVRFGRTVLTLLAGFFFGLGWLAARGFALAWLGLAWTVTAFRLGWVQGATVRRGNG